MTRASLVAAVRPPLSTTATLLSLRVLQPTGMEARVTATQTFEGLRANLPGNAFSPWRNQATLWHSAFPWSVWMLAVGTHSMPASSWHFRHQARVKSKVMELHSGMKAKYNGKFGPPRPSAPPGMFPATRYNVPPLCDIATFCVTSRDMVDVFGFLFVA